MEIYDTSRAGFEPEQNLSLGFVEGSYVVVMTTIPRCGVVFIAQINHYGKFTAFHELIWIVLPLTNQHSAKSWSFRANLLKLLWE